MSEDLHYNQQIVEYLRKNLKKGYSRDSLKWALVSQGHSNFEIERAFRRVDREMAKSAPILKTKPQIKYERIDEDERSYPVVLEPKKPFWKKFFG